MPRRMSFSMTEPQFLDGSKTVTRRMGWLGARAGDRVIAVRKCMGLKKGERQHVLGEIEIVSVSREPLDAITAADVAREGFPGRSCAFFVAMFCKAMRCWPSTTVTRIEFRHLEAPPNE